MYNTQAIIRPGPISCWNVFLVESIWNIYLEDNLKWIQIFIVILIMAQTYLLVFEKLYVDRFQDLNCFIIKITVNIWIHDRDNYYYYYYYTDL